MSYREVSEVRDGMQIDWDMPIRMDDGIVLRCDVFRPVDRIVMQEWAAAFQFVLEVRQPPARAAAIFVVLAAHRERDAIARRHHDRGRPQLDVEFDRLAGVERLLLVVRVIGAVRRRELWIELAVRGAQPALRDRRVRVDRALEHDLLHVGGEDAQHQEQIGVGGR